MDDTDVNFPYQNMDMNVSTSAVPPTDNVEHQVSSIDRRDEMTNTVIQKEATSSVEPAKEAEREKTLSPPQVVDLLDDAANAGGAAQKCESTGDRVEPTKSEVDDLD